jgi:hypothetical protein
VPEPAPWALTTDTAGFPASEVAPELATTVSPGPATAFAVATACDRCLLGRAAAWQLLSSRAATQTKITADVLMMAAESAVSLKSANEGSEPTVAKA